MGKPIMKFSAGTVQVAVWENESAKGNYKTVSIEKRFKDGDNWRSSNSFKVNELPKAILALQKAYESISMKQENA
ncbi:MAG: hypothetical protein AABW99_01200 [archaeon]